MVSPVTIYHCKVKELPSQLALSIRLRTPLSELSQRVGRAFGAIAAYLADQRLAPAGVPFVAYYNMDMQDLDIEAVIPVARKLPGTSARFAPRGQGVVWGQTGIGPHAKDERHFVPSIDGYYRALEAFGKRLTQS